MRTGEASSTIQIPTFGNRDIELLDHDSIAPFLAHRYNIGIQQVILNAGEYRELIEDAHRRGWDKEKVKQIIFGGNRFLESTHTLFGTERDFGERGRK